MGIFVLRQYVDSRSLFYVRRQYYRPGLPKSASKYVAQIYGILDGRIWTVSLLPALKSSSKCFSATLFTVTAKRPAKSLLLGLFYRSQLKSDQPTTGGGGRVVKERLPRALPWPPNAFHTTLVAYLVLLECFDSDRRRRRGVEGCN